ncbi:autotransporter-associated N-terminal domain-containing protein, partial [Fusobacterium polymorphum]|uniref:autotransporter-associated N-terminal domain-containing protein n=1 Tax=Fusobacterium nucleatum subsp. polymorphum TaxID=76857 RepID=UPI003009CE47
RSIAKRYKSVKYSLGLAILFLMMGVSAFSEEVVAQEAVAQQEVMTAEQIASSKDNLKDSIGGLKSKIDTARAENEKSLAGLRLELIQLMEQGDQVVKSPWASWQFGAGYIYSNWQSSYKGRGDKSKKYPFEGIFSRETGAKEFNRYVNENSSMYSYLSKSNDVTSASSNLRGNTNNYGLASNITVPENPIAFQISASIKPRIVTKGAITISTPAALSPTLPKAIDFRPVTPKVAAPVAPTVTVSTPPTITFQAQGFGQDRQAMIHGSQGIHLMNFSTYTATGTATFNVADNSSTLSTGSIAYNPGNLASLTLPPGKSAHPVQPAGTITAGDTTPYYMNAVFSHVVPMNVTMTGNYVVNSTATHNILFISVNPYDYYETPGDKKFSFQGNVTLNSNGGSSLVGIEHQLLNGDGGGGSVPVNQVASIVENRGTITLASGQNMIGMMLDTEYFGNPAYYKFTKSPQTNNEGKIIIGSSATNSVGFDYGYYHTGTSNEGPNGTIKVGTIIINGNSNYGYRQKYYSATPNYYNGMGTVSGATGIITLNGKNNVGYSIAHGKTTGDPISNLSKMQVQVNGQNNVGFLRNADTSTTLNTTAITLDAAKLGNTFNFGTAATGGALIRSDINEVKLSKSITVPKTGTKNSLMQAGKSGTVTLNTGSTITSTSSAEFYGMTAGNFAGADGKTATAKNLGTLNIGGNKSLGMAVDVDDQGNNSGKINFSGTNGAAVYNTGTFTSTNTGEINVTGKNSIGAYNKGTLTVNGKVTTKADKTTGIFSEAGTVTNTGMISTTGKSVKAIVGKGTTTITSTGKVIVNGSAFSATDGAVGFASMNGATVSQSNAATSVTVNDSASIGAYADGKVGIGAAVTTKLNVTGGTITAKGGAFNTYAANSGVITLNGATLNTEPKSLAFYTTDNGKIDFGTGTTKTTANIKGGTDSNSRGTAFLYKGTGASYSKFDSKEISKWAAANFAHLNNLKLVMEKGSRLFIAQNVAMDLSNTNPGNLLSGLPTGLVTGSNDYKTFMLYLSKLSLNQNINLDNPTDAYNKLEISNSSIENNNANVITGKSTNKVAIAQENYTTIARDKVKLINKGSINLSGANSTAIYGKFAEILNDTTGTINVGANSAAIYGTTSSKLENKGTINLGANSVGIFSKGDTAAGYKISATTYKGLVVNSGKIISTGKSIGVTYNGIGTGVTDTRITNETTGKINLAGQGSVGIYGLGSNYNILNKGEITLGNSSNISTSPNVGVYTAVETVSIKNNPTGKIKVGNNSVGAYGYDVENNGNITTGNNGVAIYSKRKAGGISTVTNTGNITVGGNNATALFLENGGNLNLNAGTLNVGAGSYGVVAIGNKSFTYNNNAAVNVKLGTGATYFYSNNPTTNFTNNIALNSTNKRVYGISTVGTVTNAANMTLGDESVGVLYNGTGTARNTANIKVGNSDVDNKNYAIGMATKTGTVENTASGVITVGSSGIGLFADGANARAINNGTINLNGANAMGMYLDNRAIGINNGTIKVNGSQEGAVGVVVQHGAKIINNGTITIDGKNGFAFFKATGGIIENRNRMGIQLSGGAKEIYDPTSKPTSKTTGSVSIKADRGATPATTKITVAGVPQRIEQIIINTPKGKTGPAPTSLGIYVDTLGGTNPITGNLGLITTQADLILGNEVAKTTTSKNIIVSGSVLDPYNRMLAANSGVEWQAYAGALTWTATPLYKSGLLGSVVLAKIPYTEFAGDQATPVDKKDTYNFLNGLEQRYGVDPVGSREKQLFDKLNEIGKNEKVLFYQATDEMMGHQYANVQQRINATGNILENEFDNLRNEWKTASKDSNKIKTFGTNGEYKTDTAGIINYKYNAYGVAYVHENEDIKLGKGIGWYAGIVQNTIKFKDIGKSKEEQLQGKVGLYKSVPFDDNNSLNWTISGDIFAGYNKMKRKFLVVDEVFGAKAKYYNYGISIKNEIGKEFRLNESFTLRPYAALDLEYGRISKIREKSGEIKLEVKQNDYISVKPEIGAELGFKHYFGAKTFRAGLGVAYENELGKVANGKNKAKVANTTADWFNIRGEKEDRRGNVKFDLNLGLDNQRFGVTGNVGYDTKGQNVRGGLGLRVIF